jgi:hypothetical protein
VFITFLSVFRIELGRSALNASEKLIWRSWPRAAYLKDSLTSGSWDVKNLSLYRFVWRQSVWDLSVFAESNAGWIICFTNLVAI